jgi:hypothetical protein
MRKISNWAHHHILATRLLLVFFIYPALNLAGWILGSALYEEGWSIGFSWGYPLSFITVIIIALYDSKRKGLSYRQGRFFHLLLALTSFIFILITGTRSTLEPGSGASSHYSYTVQATETIHSRPSVKKQKKGINRLLDRIRKKYAKSDDGTKAVLIILAVLAAIGLILLVGALACSIACSGSEALAYVVFFLGLGGIILGLVKIIQRISRGPRKKAAPAANS